MHKGIPHPVELEPTTHAFVDSLAGGKPLETLTPTDARAVLTGLQTAAAARLHDAEVEDLTLPVGPTGQTKIRIVRPTETTVVLPVIVYMHGGGWVLGDRETHNRLIRELAVGADAALVFVDYERSPEARYPVAVEQGYAVAKYLAENAAKFGVDAKRMAIAGDSVGGNMAAVIALLAKERSGPAIKTQLLIYPVTDASMSTESYETFATGPWLTKTAMAWFWDQYIPLGPDRADIHVSPINATKQDLSGLPPTLLMVDENDVLRDEGEEYGRKLAEAGVRVTTVRYNGTIHDFMMLDALASTPAVRGAVGLATSYLLHKFSAV